MKELWNRIIGNGVLGGRGRRMRLCETLSLGERRFLAVVRVDDQQFLIGGSGNSVALLTTLSTQSGEIELAAQGSK